MIFKQWNIKLRDLPPHLGNSKWVKPKNPEKRVLVNFFCKCFYHKCITYNSLYSSTTVWLKLS